MDNKRSDSLLQTAPFGYAYHKVLLDEDGKPYDYEFLEANKAFEEFTGLKISGIIGKKISQVLPDIQKDEFDWIGFYGNIALNKSSADIEQYSQPLNQWYRIQVRSFEKYYFATFITNVNDQHVLSEALHNLQSYSSETIDYKEITDSIQKISGAQYAAFNLYDKEGLRFTTMSVSGINENIKKAMGILGFNLQGKRWEYDPIREAKIKKRKITRFHRLSEITGKTIPEKSVKLLERAFSLGEVLVIKIAKEELVAGDFILLYNTPVNEDRLQRAESYADAIAMLLYRIRAEEALKAGESLLKKLSLQIPGVIYQFQYYPNGRSFFPYASENIYNLFEVTPQQIIHDAQPILTKIHPSDYQPFMASLLNSFEKLTPWDHDFKVILPSKGIRWARVNANPEKQSDGSVLWHGHISDITERKKSEQQIAQLKERFELAIDGSNDGIWDWNLRTNELFLSKRWKQMLGYEDHELANHIDTFFSLLHEDDRERVDNYVKEYLHSREGKYELDFRMIHKDGSLRWITAKGAALRNMDNIASRMAGSHTDITDKKTKERLEKEIEVSRNTIKFKQNFLASMSHEMRTPLNGIMGVTHLIQKTQLDKDQQDFVDMLKQSSDNLAMIIDQVLDYASLEAGKIQLNISTFKIADILDHASKFFSGITEKPLKFVGYIDPDLPDHLKFDKKRILQVINNLLINAAKYTSAGEIGVSIKRQSQQSDDNEGILIHVEVTDTGIGIREDRQKAMFSSFSQVHQIESEHYSGIGLGLAICKEIVELHGGEIGIKSKPGKGTTVWFNFKSMAPEEKSSTNEQNSKESKNIKILLVEDKQTTQKVVKMMLNSLGHTVSLADNGQDAIVNFTITDFDLILMDIQMPVMDGIAATRSIKNKYKDPPPIVGLSSNVFDGDREKYMSLGMDEFITKPFKIEEFKRVMARLFPET
jgi:PAS domain S-box-containing protein